jgi:hypothetical protein
LPTRVLLKRLRDQRKELFSGRSITHVCSLKSTKDLSLQLGWDLARIHAKQLQQTLGLSIDKLLVKILNYLMEVAKEYPKFELSFFEPNANGL